MVLQKKLFIFFLGLFFLTNFIFAQKNDFDKSQIAALKYCIQNLNFPLINSSIEESKAKQLFEKETKEWHMNNPGYDNVLKNIDYYKYKLFLKTIAIENYPPKPNFIDTGNSKQDEINYKKAIKQWSENHPDYPQYIDTGNPKQDKENLRKARLDFYNKYIKED